MIYKTNNLNSWLEFEKLQPYPFLRHAITLKGTGLPFLSETFGPISELHQIHGTECMEIHERNALGRETGDALFTSLTHRPLAIRHADCQAAILFDPVKRAVAVIHAGWKGLVQGIYQKTIDQFNTRYHSNPADLLFCIGPSLGPENSEFIHYQREFPPSFWPFQMRPFYFDLWKIAEHQALEAGILPHHIEIARLDTAADPTLYHSWRGEKTTDRHYTVAMLC